jgi:hypothetical protein
VITLGVGLNAYYDYSFDILGISFATLAALFGALNNHVILFLVFFPFKKSHNFISK